MMNKNFDVLGIGQISVDDLIVLPEFPKIDNKIQIVNKKKQIGGSIPTSLKMLSALNIKTSFIGKIADDINSLFIKRELVSSKIDLSNLIIERQSIVPSSQVWIDIKTGTQTTAFDTGTISGLKPENIDSNRLPKAKFLHIDGKEPEVLDKIIEKYKAENTQIIIDTGSFQEMTPVFLPYADIIIMPFKFASKLFKEKNLTEMISQAGMIYPDKTIVITDGHRGSICCKEEKIYRQKAFKIDTVDTHGAGDFFSAGFIYGLLKEWDIPKILVFSSAIAAMKCTQLGKNIHFSEDDVHDFIKSNT